MRKSDGFVDLVEAEKYTYSVLTHVGSRQPVSCKILARAITTCIRARLTTLNAKVRNHVFTERGVMPTHNQARWALGQGWEEAIDVTILHHRS